MSGRLCDEQRGGDLAELVSTIRAAQALSVAMKDAAGTDLARVVTVCCAADAQLARIHGRAALSLGGKSTADAGDATTAGV